jgi:hypothetical protein
MYMCRMKSCQNRCVTCDTLQNGTDSRASSLGMVRIRRCATRVSPCATLCHPVLAAVLAEAALTFSPNHPCHRRPAGSGSIAVRSIPRLPRLSPMPDGDLPAIVPIRSPASPRLCRLSTGELGAARALPGVSDARHPALRSALTGLAPSVVPNPNSFVSRACMLSLRLLCLSNNRTLVGHNK